MKALFIYNMNLWLKRWTSYFAFIFLTFVILIPALPWIFSQGNAPKFPSSYALTGGICVTMLITNVMLFGSNFLEMRKTTLIKRLGTTRLSKFELIVGYALWFIVVDLLIILYAFALMGILILANVYEPLYFWTFTWSGVIWGLAMFTVMSLAIGFFFATISKSFAVFNMLSTFYLIMYVITVIVSGFLSAFNVDASFLHIFNWLLPTSFVSEFLRGSFSGANVWSLSNGYYVIPGLEITYVGIWQTNANIWIPILLTTGLLLGTNYLFRWDQK